MADSRSDIAPGEGETPLTATRSDSFALRREDLAAVVADYRLQSRRPHEWIGVVTGIGSLFLAALLIFAGGYFHWPEGLGPVSFVGGWVGLLSSLVVVRRRSQRLRDQLQIHCPACAQPLLDETLNRPGVPRAEVAIATGNCPYCGAHILAP